MVWLLTPTSFSLGGLPTKPRFNRFFFFPAIIFLLSVIAIAVVGLLYYTDQKAAIKKEKQTELLAIADLKVGEIESWYNGQLSDSHIIMRDPFAVSSIRKWLANENQARLKQDIFNFLELIKNTGNFYSASLLDSNGNIRLSSYDEPSLIHDYEKKWVSQALSKRKVIFSDLSMSGTSGLIHIDIYVPLQGAGNVLVGVVLLQVNPNINLYPLVQSWPTPSPSAETLLVRREGDQVLFLNELRHQKGTALKLRFPLSKPDLPGSMAARGESGVTEGVDYRGVKVVAAIKAVHGLPWMMVSKVDKAELYAPIKQRLWAVSVIIMAFTVAAGTGIGLFWYKQSTDYYIKQYTLEKELLKAQKLESVGILAGGIAHDYNNLLQGIIGYIGLAKSYAGEDKLKEMLEKAEKTSNSAKELSFRLLTFSKGGEPVMRVIDMSRLIEETASMALCDLHVICDFHFPGDLHSVEGDEGQLYQVIRNISMNAREAMPDGGKLIYTAENVTIGEGSNLALSKGEYVRTSISDTGTGITAEHLPKIFDPYFTTKELGSDKGTGLGLSVCYSIIRKHKGLITVESTKGVGTTFHIYLPACVDKQPSL